MNKVYSSFFCLLLLSFTTCEEIEYDHLLIVSTDKNIQVLLNSDAVTLKGAILDIGNLPLTAYGFCYRDSIPGEITITSSSVNNIILTERLEVGTFENKIYGLTKETPYVYRAFARTSEEVKYGKQYYFRTGNITTPVFSAQVNNISKTTASAVGAISENQFAAVGGAIGEHGHCWSTEQNPEITDAKTTLGTLTAAHHYTSQLTGLSAGATYYVRAYIIPTSDGTPIYSNNEVTFKTVQ